MVPRAPRRNNHELVRLGSVQVGRQAARRGRARGAGRAPRRGQKLSPIAIVGRTIARTFWGKAWCDNLERYRDFAYRLERGRSYVRSGSVLDLQIAAGQIAAAGLGSQRAETA